MEDGQHGDVGLSSAGRSTDQEVLVGVVGRLKHDGLDPVQALQPFEDQLTDLLRSKTWTHDQNRSTRFSKALEHGGNTPPPDN